ncbi:MAG: hypothetical protein H7Z43_06040 [Clostridia bacterium]|nr:hypothetical protein [Deltaproteobacteria bacterium]
MRHSIILFIAGLFSCSGTDECDLAREQLNVDQTDSYGEACEGPFGYEGCKAGIDSCNQGDCRILTEDSRQRICTRDCGSDSDCTGIGTCREGFCQPRLTAL